MDETWAHDALRRLAAAGLCTVDAGLTESELSGLERRLMVRFGAEHRALLAAGVPRGRWWPDWRGDEIRLRSYIGAPARGLLAAVRTGFWATSWRTRPDRTQEAEAAASRIIAGAPRLLPLYGIAYATQASEPPGVIAVDGPSVTAAAPSVAAYLSFLCDDAIDTDLTERISFWSDLIDPLDDEPEHFTPLPAPPFGADLDVPSAPAVQPRAAEQVFAELGLSARPHDGILADGTLLWTAPAGPNPALLWETLRDRFPTTGLWPLLITPKTLWRCGFQGGIAETQCLAPLSPQGLLHTPLDGEAWLDARFSDDGDDGDDADDIERYDVPIAGPDTRSWLEVWEPHSAPYTEIALVPAPAHWYVPGLLRWSGSANYDVGGVDHATMLRRWHPRWGTELLALDDETMVLRVAHAPTATAALGAALEYYLYCPDAVAQDAGSLDSLANWCRHPVWLLWWD